jgi:hypothetical protein
VPLQRRLIGLLVAQLTKTPGAVRTPDGIGVAVGPLSLLVTDNPGHRTWLLTGTVTTATLHRAAAELAANPPQERPR